MGKNKKTPKDREMRPYPKPYPMPTPSFPNQPNRPENPFPVFPSDSSYPGPASDRTREKESVVSTTCEQPYGDTLIPTNVVQGS